MPCLFPLCFFKTTPLHKGSHEKYSESLFEDLPHIYEAFEVDFVSAYTIFSFHTQLQKPVLLQQTLLQQPYLIISGAVKEPDMLCVTKVALKSS